VAEVQAKTRGQLCLMGNVAALDLGVRGTPEMVKEAARQVLEKSQGGSLILSFGGGVSPGTPKENLMALAEAAGSSLPGK
jgi:uroporphyrinogen decarboxylase